MSDSKQTPSEQTESHENSGENTEQGGNNDNNNKQKFNNKQKHNQKQQRQYNEQQSTQYEGSNPEIGGILALRNENFSKKVPFSVFQQKLKNHILTEFDYEL